MSLKDYVDRKYDYLALQNTAIAGNQQLGLQLFTEKTSGKLCVGVQKLAQRWLLEFMTEEGSMPGLPTRGCAFLTTARRGGFRVRVNISAAFSTANATIKQKLRAEEYAGMPDDERFDNAELLSFVIIPGLDSTRLSGTTIIYLKMTVKIISRAGSSYDIIFPVETIP